MRSTNRRIIASAAIAIIVLIGVGAGKAYAYLHATGSGSGQGTTGAVSLSLTVHSGSGLVPGGSVNVTVGINNTGSTAPLTITSLTQTGSTSIQSAGKGTCDPSVVSFSDSTLPGTITAGGSANATGTVSMTSAAFDGCQGTTFSMTLQASGHT